MIVSFAAAILNIVRHARIPRLAKLATPKSLDLKTVSVPNAETTTPGTRAKQYQENANAVFKIKIQSTSTLSTVTNVNHVVNF